MLFVMRRSKTPPIPPQLYRHFAFVTLALTASLAMFADGESHEAQASAVQTEKPKAAARPAAFTSPNSAQDVDTAARAFARDMSADFDNSFGQPMARIAGGGAIADEATAPAAVTPEAMANLTAAERELLLRQLREAGLPLPGAQAR